MIDNKNSILLLDVLSILLFVIVTIMVVGHGNITILDKFVYDSIPNLRSFELTSVFVSVTNILSPENLSVLALIVVLLFAWKKKLHAVSIFIIGVGGALLSGVLIKAIAGIARPVSILVVETGKSFPSNHAVVATAFFSLIFYCLYKKIPGIIGKTIFGVVCLALIVVTDFSRIYLSAHWFSDILGGTFLALFWVFLSIMISEFLHHKKLWQKF
ncbi:MAG: phosphatase PAP2 family protein [Parcubacteria group bacterium]|nr:phosphatase PAP2 family protein [Parcubacteria group bacterium]